MQKSGGEERGLAHHPLPPFWQNRPAIIHLFQTTFLPTDFNANSTRTGWKTSKIWPHKTDLGILSRGVKGNEGQFDAMPFSQFWVPSLQIQMFWSVPINFWVTRALRDLVLKAFSLQIQMFNFKVTRGLRAKPFPQKLNWSPRWKYYKVIAKGQVQIHAKPFPHKLNWSPRWKHRRKIWWSSCQRSGANS